ncbi:MAG: C40 family peptidase [Candidatus Colwellbacteria bacterium]|nr:C40 family peptidase [Candidatus Colwellbacteria bacterium]
MSAEEKVAKVIGITRGLIGRPYKYGAKTEEAPEFFDCSGFVQYVFKKAGVELPRSTIEQAAEGIEVEIEKLKPGDLIFAHGKYGHYDPRFPEGIGHVAIYIGDGKVIHAASRRIEEKPIREEGAVIESSLADYISGWAPVVVIKRMI